MAKPIPISTIIRKALPEGAWKPGWSVTYSDTSQPKTKKTTRWATKDLYRDMTAEEQKALKIRLIQELAGLVDIESIGVYRNEVNVYKTTPIQVTELG